MCIASYTRAISCWRDVIGHQEKRSRKPRAGSRSGEKLFCCLSNLALEPGSGTSGFTNGEGFTGLRRELWTARQQCVSGSGSAQGEIAETCNAMLRGHRERPAQTRAAFQRQRYQV